MPEKSALQDFDLPTVLRALAFATEKHRGQVRKDAEATPYIQHPIALASLLWAEAGVRDSSVVSAAILHDTIEDTPTTHDELEKLFGREIADIVAEVTDDKGKPKGDRKKEQVEHAASLSAPARLVKLADKTCNLRDVARTPPVGWDIGRQQDYFDWSKSVVDRIRGSHAELERLFDAAYRDRP